MKKLMACLVAACAFTAVAEKGDEYVTDKGGGVYEVDATTGLTLDDFSEGWSNRFYNSTDTFVFKGAGEKGMCFDNRTLFETKPYTNQFSHLVFDGGVQTYGWYPSNQIDAATLRLAAGSTRENPAIKVKSGTTLNFFNRTFRSGTGRYGADLGAWFEIEDGATLILTNDSPRASYTETSYLLFPTILHPGATYALSLVDVESPLNTSGCRSTFTQDTLFYVPATTPGDTRIARVDVRLSWVYVNMPANETTPGFGMDVGENATLEFTGRIGGNENNKYFPVCKYGAGTLDWKGVPEQANRHFNVLVKAGTFIYNPVSRNTYESLLKPEVSSGATLELPSENPFVQRNKVAGLLNDGTVRVTGTGATTLWDCRKVGTIETPDGATVSFARTVDPYEGRAPAAGEDISRLGIYDADGNSYTVTGGDTEYVYWDCVEELSADAALSGVHSLKAVNPTPGTPVDITATASDYAIAGRYVTIEVGADVTLTVDAPVSGVIQNLSGDGDLVLRVGPNLKILSAGDFAGHLTVRGGYAVLPASMEGRVTALDGAQVRYASLDDFALASVSLTVTNYTGETTLENYPYLLRVSKETVPALGRLGANVRLWKILAADGSECPFDVETWNQFGESLVWVRLPELSKAGATVTLLFGDEFYPPTFSASETWRRTDNMPGTAGGSGNYAGVWHMASPSQTDVPDATGNGLTAVPYYGTSTNMKTNRTESTTVVGAIGAGRHVSSSPVNGGYRLRVAAEDYARMKVATNFTVSTWVNFASGNSYPRFFSHGVRDSGSGTGWEIHGAASDDWRQRANGSAVASWTDKWQNHVGSWVHYAFVYDGLKLSAYLNGEPLAATQTLSAGSEAPLDPTAGLCLGGADKDWSLVGSLDEARIFDGALSAEWVRADYETQKADAGRPRTDGSVQKASLDAVVSGLLGDTLDVSAAVTGPAGSTHTVTATLFDASGVQQDTKSVEVTCPAEAIDFVFAGLQPATGYQVRVSATDVRESDIYAFDVTTLKRYQALSGDNGNSSLQFSDTKLHSNNWVNVSDSTDVLRALDADSDYDFVVDATQGPDPTESGYWQMRTWYDGNGTTAAYDFPGRRLTIIGDRQSDLTYANGGGLSLKNYYGSETWTGLVTVPELVLKNGSVWTEISTITSLKSKIAIPEGYSGFFETARNETTERFLRLYGSLEGAGTAVFCHYSQVDNLRGFYFYNDLSGFTGKVWFNKSRNIRFCAGCVPFADRAELTTDGVTLDNRYHKITTGYRASDNAVNRLVFESDMTWATPNRGITFADSDSSRNDWGVAIADGATVSIASPLYGAAADKGAAKTRFGINGELEGFRTGTLRLCGAQGDWAGTFVATNGTLVLAGAKPLGEGTLDISGAAHVELDASALAGGACYVKAATDATRIGVTLPDGFDPETDLALISTPAEGGVKKDQLVFSGGLPEGLALRSSVRGGVRTFAVGRKHGLVLIFR